jgi:NAD(P)-dependent dehydrogenase (short-subunit alcohol dehydrogenase family)
MDLQLTGKRAFVSGSTAGIGLAIARALAREGARVTINGRTQARVDAALATLQGDVHGLAADLATPAGADTLAAALPEVDILVNNLGIFEPKPFLDIPDADWRTFFDVNVLSGVRLARLYLPAMLRARWGRVLFISSESGVQSPAEMVHYGVTKTAQIALARGIAESVAGTGVTVNSVLPGPTSSEGVAGFVSDLEIGRASCRERVS